MRPLRVAVRSTISQVWRSCSFCSVVPKFEVGGKVQQRPAFGSVYSGREITTVANCVLKQFGAKDSKVTAKNVRNARQC